MFLYCTGLLGIAFPPGQVTMVTADISCVPPSWPKGQLQLIADQRMTTATW